MSRETEAFFRQLQVFLDQHEDEFENVDEAINYYVTQFNAGLIDEPDDDASRALDLLEMALDYEDADERLALLEEANQLDPHNLDIYCALCLERYGEMEAIPYIEEKTAEYFKTHRQSIKDSSYAGIENRPYFRARKFLLDFYKQEYLLGKAENTAKELLRNNPNDNLGARYSLMGTYVLSFQHKKARSFFKKEPMHQEDDQMLFYMAVSLILDEDIQYAERIIKKLLKINPTITRFFIEQEFDSFLVYSFLPDEYYQPNSERSLAIAFAEVLSLFQHSEYLYWTFQKILKQTNPEYFDQYYAQQVNWLNSYAEAYELAGTGIFTNISSQYVRPLLLEGLRTLEDFQAKGEREVLAIDGIGKGTVKKLRENGVTFKGE
ncbi:hypothetical protein [Falseniella ignava]|uniref:Uncharacterized protein n=1 Tax=Falseniella ignava CCUG 37419 TaxID=883112 RepID=K1MD98_9LACT|nr:hypothetical protein [Falseniella ignava]EKB54059.1 hypothetical protein HMPREF9707_01360 [Falseniella ignava CCUG 37419]